MCMWFLLHTCIPFIALLALEGLNNLNVVGSYPHLTTVHITGNLEPNRHNAQIVKVGVLRVYFGKLWNKNLEHVVKIRLLIWYKGRGMDN